MRVHRDVLEQREARARAGYSLVEVVLGAFFLASMFLVAGLAMDRTFAAFRQRRAEQGVSASANRVLQRIADQLAFAERDSLAPATLTAIGSELVVYRVSRGLEDGSAAFGPACRISWQYEPGELDDGLDNNENGLVDEGIAVLTESLGAPEERSVILEHGVAEHLWGEEQNGVDDNGNGLLDERGLCFVLDGDALVVRASFQAAGPTGATITRTLETAVFVRN